MDFNVDSSNQQKITPQQVIPMLKVLKQKKIEEIRA